MLDRWKRYETWVEFGTDDNNGFPSGGVRWLGFFWTKKAALRAGEAVEFSHDERTPQYVVVAYVPRGDVIEKDVIDCRYLAPPDPHTTLRPLG